MKNEYEIRGDVTAIFLKSKKYGDMETLISTEKLDKVKEFLGSWYLSLDKKSRSFYVLGNGNGDSKGKTIVFHRLITGAPRGMVVDHINHQTLDNTDVNLRVLTNAENLQNRKGATKNSKSGVRGVTRIKGRNKWQATIAINGKCTYLGLFETIEAAELVVKEARLKHMPYSKEAIT